MILAVDIGGTKTLVALFDKAGKIIKQRKFPTSQNYEDFLATFSDEFKSLDTMSIDKTVVAIPGRLDRATGIGLVFGNLPWKNVPIQSDVKAIVKNTVLVENDAKLGGFGEAMAIKDKFQKVLYLTIGTGIGVAFTADSQIDTSINDLGGNTIKLMHDGKLVSWDSFASGKAIFKHYGKKASEIDDPKIWESICLDLTVGILELLSVITPDCIVLGGGVSKNFDKFGKILARQLNESSASYLIPPIISAKRPVDAVIYGCYEYAKQNQ
ncbi:MAG TPA: ROK family protein [Candidatus Saccharimonadales bacterium]|nr:ROK family protein [Candidatus Saccharimonadales bacterium]